MFIIGIDPTEVGYLGTATDAAHAVGQLGMTSDGKIYKYVKYTEGTGALDLAAGDVVYYQDVTGYTNSVVTADVSDSTGAELGAGVAPVAVTTDASYFWIQIKGPATINVALGGSAGDGDPLTAVAAADKGLTKAAEADSTATYVSVVAYAVDASAKTIACAFPF